MKFKIINSSDRSLAHKDAYITAPAGTKLSKAWKMFYGKAAAGGLGGHTRAHVMHNFRTGAWTVVEIEEVLAPTAPPEQLALNLEHKVPSRGKLDETFNDWYLKESNKVKVYCDMDGVLTDFERAVESIGRGTVEELLEKGQPALWGTIGRAGESFWSGMEWMPDGKELWEALKPLNPIILSSPLRSNASKIGKRKWCEEHLGGDVEVILESKKYEYAEPNCILIDDTLKKVELFESHGGLVIHHTTTAQTLKELNDHLSNLSA
jgi:hypothetical protein